MIVHICEFTPGIELGVTACLRGTVEIGFREIAAPEISEKRNGPLSILRTRPAVLRAKRSRPLGSGRDYRTADIYQGRIGVTGQRHNAGSTGEVIVPGIEVCGRPRERQALE